MDGMSFPCGESGHDEIDMFCFLQKSEVILYFLYETFYALGAVKSLERKRRTCLALHF